MIIVGGSYSHKDDSVKKARIQIIANACIKLMADGKTNLAVSPLLYGLTLIDYTEKDGVKLSDSYKFWQEFCLGFVRAGDEFNVLDMEGWEQSKGLADEIKEAKKLNIPVYLINHITLEFKKVL